MAVCWQGNIREDSEAAADMSADDLKKRQNARKVLYFKEN
jgi:hypothetical protein